MAFKKIFIHFTVALVMFAALALAVNYPMTPKADIDLQGHQLLNAGNVTGNISWKSIDDWPPNCSAGYYVSGLDDSVTCTDSGMVGSTWTDSQNASDKNLTGVNVLEADEFNMVLYVPEGGTDMDIRAKIEECNVSGVQSCKIIIPKGTFNVTDQIVPLENMTIEGAGMGITILKAINTIDEAVIIPKTWGGTNRERITLRDFTIDMDNYQYHGILLRYAKYSTVENIEIKNSNGSALYVSSGTWYSYFNNIHILDNADGFGLYLDTSHYNRYNNIHIKGGAVDGLVVRQARNNVFTNFIISNTGKGQSAGYGYGHGVRVIDNARENTFVNFKIYDTFANGFRLNGGYGNVVIGANIMDTGSTGIRLKEAAYSTISSCYVRNSTHAIHVSGDYNTVVGNTFKSMRDTPIYLSPDSPYDSENNIISSNVIWNNVSTEPLYYGIHLASGCDDNTIIGNKISGYNTSMIYDLGDDTFIVNEGTLKATSAEISSIDTDDIISSIIYDKTTQGVQLAMNFNNGSVYGSSILDSSSENHHGIVHNAIHNSTGGFNGGGVFDFDGIDDYIEITNAAGFNTSITGELTLSAWVYPRGFGDAFGGMISKGSGVPICYAFAHVDTTAELYFSYRDGGGWHDVNSGLYMQQDKWNYIAVSFNGTNVTFIVNDTFVVKPYLHTLPTSTGSVFIGHNNVNYFDGLIDEVEISDQAISTDILLAKYRTQKENPNSFVSQKNIKVNTTAIYPQNDINYGTHNFTMTASDGTIGNCGMLPDKTIQCS